MPLLRIFCFLAGSPAVSRLQPERYGEENRKLDKHGDGEPAVAVVDPNPLQEPSERRHRQCRQKDCDEFAAGCQAPKIWITQSSNPFLWRHQSNFRDSTQNFQAGVKQMSLDESRKLCPSQTVFRT